MSSHPTPSKGDYHIRGTVNFSPFLGDHLFGDHVLGDSYFFDNRPLPKTSTEIILPDQ